MLLLDEFTKEPGGKCCMDCSRPGEYVWKWRTDMVPAPAFYHYCHDHAAEFLNRKTRGEEER